MLLGCSSDKEPDIRDSHEDFMKVSHMIVKFNGNTYETDVKTIGDSVIYLNHEYAEIYSSQISNNPEIATLVHADDSGIYYVEYYSSEKELLQKYEFLHIENSDFSAPQTKGDKIIDLMPTINTSPILARAELYDDKQFDDTRLFAYATTTWQNSVAKLSQYGFNDKTSSIKVFNLMDPNRSYGIQAVNPDTGAIIFPTTFHSGYVLRPVLKCYHNSNFSGAKIYCIALRSGQNGEHADYNLKNIGWNDRISSIEFLLVYSDSLFEGENPEIPAHPEC